LRTPLTKEESGGILVARYSLVHFRHQPGQASL
jgi:hypothetical protein